MIGGQPPTLPDRVERFPSEVACSRPPAAIGQPLMQSAAPSPIAHSRPEQMRIWIVRLDHLGKRYTASWRRQQLFLCAVSSAGPRQASGAHPAGQGSPGSPVANDRPPPPSAHAGRQNGRSRTAGRMTLVLTAGLAPAKRRRPKLFPAPHAHDPKCEDNRPRGGLVALLEGSCRHPLDN